MKKNILFYLFIFSFLCSYAQCKKKEYEITHGKEVKDFIAPYLKEISEDKKINIDSLTQILLGSIQYKDFVEVNDVIISSNQYVTANWTYFTARTPLIYQIIEIQPHLFCVLYTKLSPYPLLDKKKNENSEWRIAIVNDQLKVIDEKIFFTKWKYNNESLNMWDMIFADLKKGNGKIVATISYIHIGNGGKRDQEFNIVIDYKNKIKSINVNQITDNCFGTCYSE